jgi:hypothetical protein
MANPTQPQLDKFTINVDRMDSFINDDAATTVPVDSGTIPTLSGTVEEIETTGQAAIDTFNTDATTALDTFETDGEAAIDSLKSYNVTGAWVTGTSYNVKDVAEEAGVQYLCLEDHVAGTFATDLAAKKWTVFVLDFNSAPLNVLGDLYVDDNLGIGTTTPVTKLDVVGDFRLGDAGVFNKLVLKTGDASGIFYEGLFEIYPSTVPGSGLAEHLTYFRSNSSVGETRHDVAIDGKLGLGTTAPSRTIDILKDEAVVQLKSTGSTKSARLILDSDTADATIEMEASNITTWTQGMDRSNSNTYIWANGGSLGTSPRMALTTGGNLGVGTTNPQALAHFFGGGGVIIQSSPGTGSDASLQLWNDTGRQLRISIDESQANIINFQNSTDIVMSITQDGDVGINTTNPQALLDVAGTSRSSVNSSIVVEISDVSDFPAPSGGVISLVANTTYIIRGVVDLGTNRLSITQEGIKLMGFSLERDTLTTDTTGSLITTQDVSLEIIGLTLTATNSSSTILTATNYTAGQYNNGRDKDLIIQNCQIRDCYNVWDIDGYDLVDCQNVRIRYVKATTHGCKFRSTSKVQITSCELIRWFDESSLPTPSGYATVPMLEFDDNAGQSGFGAVNITGCVIHPQQTQDGIFINANSTTGFGTISSNTFVTTGLTTGEIFNPAPSTGGYSLNSTKTYDIFTNQGLRNSSASILTTVTGNTTNTALSTGVPAIMNVGGNAITRNSQRFSATNNAVITYNGSKDVYVNIIASVNFDKQGGGTDNYEFYLYKNSGSGFVLLPGSKASIGDIGGATFDQLSLTYADTATPGDQYAIYIENTTSGDDMRVTDLQFGIKE